MKFIGFSAVVVWACIGLTDADLCVGGGAKSVALKLKKEIFCNYDRSVRPAVSQSNGTSVSMHMWLKFLKFEEHSNTMEVHSWMVWQWKDEHLKWDKSEYDDLDTLQVRSSEIWVPDVALYTSADMGNAASHIGSTHCILSSAGTVLCVSPTAYSAYCNADITRWPFDSHNCSIRIGSWTNNGARINLTFSGKGVTTFEYSESREWELTSATASLHKPQYENVTYPWVGYSFILKRHAGGRAASVFIPALVLAMMTLCIFSFEPHALERLFLIALDILCHCLYLQYLDSYLPSNGDKYPIILTFYRDSLVMAGMSLVITLVVRAMIVATSEPPSWISTVVNGVLSSHIGQIFLLSGVDPKSVAVAVDSDDTYDAELVGSSNQSNGSKRWQIFAVFIDRASFVLYFLSFIILLSAYIP